ncbi:MAG TPA: PDZ domain-containing protein [Gammaproteobacteria bacterium]|nr:PDZ domain-containing protein [Gammaproteobacteria bacterium]
MNYFRPLCIIAAFLVISLPAAAEHLLLRFPTIHDNTIVFEAAGNLWKVDRHGGTAIRLTSEKGYDEMPRFSPDGKTIAFTGQYEGNTDVYTIPADGGVARRLTFHSDVVTAPPTRWGPDNMVFGWTPDGKHIVFYSRRNTPNSWYGQLFEIPADGGLPTQLPVPKGGMLSFNADGSKMAYNRIFRNFRTWKDYYGGLAQDIWIYDFNTHKVQRITHWKGTDTAPMWYRNKIYFISDRGSDKTMNLWVYDLGSQQFREITHFDTYDIDWPSLGNNAIVFGDGGELYVLDLPSEQLHRINVDVPDDGLDRRPRIVDASKTIMDFAIAPNGKRALFAARGNIFTVPEEHGATRNLTHTSNAREQHPAWSPDGKWVAYVTDASGESEIAIRPADGLGQPTQLTQLKNAYLFDPTWAPGSDKIAFSDSDNRLWYVDVSSHRVVQVAHDPRSRMHDFSWSPDGRWLAYSKQAKNNMSEIYLYNLDDNKSTQISNGWNNDRDPVFSSNGKYLYFISARHENPTFSESEFNIATLKMDGIYVATLDKDTPSPFPPQTDEGAVEKHKQKKEKHADQPHEPGAIKPIHIDLDGLMNRAVPVPIPSASIYGLASSADRIYYLTAPPQTIQGPLAGAENELHVYELAERKDHTLVTGLDGYHLSANGARFIYKNGDDYTIENALPDKSDDKHQLDLGHMEERIDPVAEWGEMYHQAWRLYRDIFYNAKMNGYNWNAIGERYGKLLPLLGCREDLNFLIGDMIASLSNSHTYVAGGDFGVDEETHRTGLLGVDFGLDRSSGRYYFKKIYAGDNTRPNYRSPLTEPGVNVRQGDYLLAVNGVPLKAPTNPYKLFVDTAGEQVELTVADNPSGDNKRNVTVQTLDSELKIRLKAWIDHNRDYVAKKSDGKIGYIYLSDMGALGMNQFIRQFYAQIDRQGLIIDDRWNGGGFIDPIVLERLRRVLVGMSTTRQRAPMTEPREVLHGYMATLINHYSASDGDIFPFYFRKYHLGPLIGTRTWGGVRGYSGDNDLLDGGYIVISSFSLYGLDSQWVLENHGVEPDIKVDALPGDRMAGKDEQIDAAVNYLMKEIKANPPKLPPPPAWLPAYPPKGRHHYLNGPMGMPIPMQARPSKGQNHNSQPSPPRRG